MTDLLDRRMARAIFLSLWALYACIGPGISAINVNSASRIGLAFAILQDHTLSIDKMAPYTIDKAEFGGHTYLDKAPGLSLMALPAVGMVQFAFERMKLPTVPVRNHAFSGFYFTSVWMGVVFTVALFTAAAAGAIYLLARHLRASRAAALFGALGYALCTPAFGWATVFFGHGLAGACLLLGLALTIFASDTQPRRREVLLACGAGVLLSWSVVVEYTSAPGMLVIAGLGCWDWRLRALPSERRVRLLLGAVGGGLAAALPLAVYNWLAFGSVLHLGYSDVVGFAGMRTGLFGVSLPRAEVLWEILAGARRGILWIAPLLLLLPLAWVASWRRFGGPITVVLVAVPVAYLLINSGYVYWDGGESTGPRHITPALPFAGLALAALWDMAGWRVRLWSGMAAGLSFGLSLMCATTLMTCPPTFDGHVVHNELLDFVVPAFVSGNLHHLLAPIGGGSAASALLLLLPLSLGVAASRVLREFPGSRSTILCRAVPH